LSIPRRPPQAEYGVPTKASGLSPVERCFRIAVRIPHGPQKILYKYNYMTDEYLDLVDNNDIVVGRKKRSEVYAEHLSNYRVVNAFLVNSENKIWIPRRTETKSIFPLCLDFSLGEHVESGEAYKQAFTRGLQEELNLDINKVKYRELGKLTPRKDSVSSFMEVYEIQSDEIPNYNKDDFIEFYWLSPEELFQRLESGEKSKDDLPKLVRIFYG